MTKYIYEYTDKYKNEKIFSCITENILEADKLYEKYTSKDPSKQSYIGCQIKEIVQ